MASERPQEIEHSDDLLKIIVNEVDEAREVLELAQQFAHAIPLRSFKDVVKALGDRGVIAFRGREFQVGPFGAHVPSFLFPIDSVKKLVTVLYEAVRRAPKHIRYSDKDPRYAKISLYRNTVLGLPVETADPPRPGSPARSK
jgi:hypothetical protein